MKKNIFLIIIISISIFSNNYAQRKIKYKDVFETIGKQDKEAVYGMLLQYQRQDPEYPNTYLQLGNLSHKWVRETDIFNDQDLLGYFIYNTKLFYDLAKIKLSLDTRDVKKNKEYYENLNIAYTKKIEYEDVVKFINEELKKIKKLEKNVKIITKNYYSCIDNYNTCVDSFYNLNIFNHKVKDIYTAPKQQTINTLDLIIKSYDSTIYYFHEFQTALKNYKILDYQPQLKVQKIKTYRIEGLSRADFLSEEILVWDYKTWATNVKNIINNDIESVRDEIKKENSRLDAELFKLSKQTNSHIYKQNFEPNKKILFKIEKFDINSAISSLFIYKINLINFQRLTKHPVNDIFYNNYSKNEPIINRYYYNLKLKLDKLDKSLTTLSEKADIYKLNKHKNFINLYYNNTENFKKFIVNEKKQFAEEQEKVFKNYLNNLQNLKLLALNDSLEYKKSKFYRLTDDNYLQNLEKIYYIHDLKYIGEKSYFLTGYINSNTKKKAFIAFVNLGQIKWLKEINLPGESQGILIDCNSAVCAFILQNKTQNSAQNIVYKYNIEGKKISELKIEDKNFPRYFKFDDINNTFHIVTKGNLKFEILSNNIITINYIDEKNTKNSWKHNINGDTEFINIIKFDKSFHYIINYKNLSLKDGTKIKTKNGKVSLCDLILSNQGKVIALKDYKDTLKDEITFVASKINSDYFSIIGLKGKYEDIRTKNISKTSKVFYTMLNKNGEIIYKFGTKI